MSSAQGQQPQQYSQYTPQHQQYSQHTPQHQQYSQYAPPAITDAQYDKPPPPLPAPCYERPSPLGASSRATSKMSLDHLGLDREIEETYF